MIMVSACLLGQKSKYNGEANANELLIKYKDAGRFLEICPELFAGLTIPRPPAEIQKGVGADVIAGRAIVKDKEGNDRTAAFVQGAEGVLELARKHNVKIAIMKENSPSCGSHFVYDGSFSGKKITGQGVTASLIGEAGVTVYSEEDITEDLLKELIQADMAECGAI